jgi:hypothetical protein
MKDKELNLEETEASHTVGGSTDTLRCINLTGVDIGLVALRGPMHQCGYVREECGDGGGFKGGFFTSLL